MARCLLKLYQKIRNIGSSGIDLLRMYLKEAKDEAFVANVAAPLQEIIA